MGTNSHTNTHTQTDNEHIFSFHFERSEPRPCTNLALPLIYCASNAVNNEKKYPSRTPAHSFLEHLNIQTRPNCNSFWEIFLVCLFMAVGTFKNTPNFHFMYSPLRLQVCRTLAKYVNIIVQLIVSHRNKCENKIRNNGFKWSREERKKRKKEKRKNIFIDSVSAVRSKLLFNCNQWLVLLRLLLLCPQIQFYQRESKILCCKMYRKNKWQ